MKSAVFLGKTALGPPPGPETRGRLAVLGRYLHATVIGTGRPGRSTVEGVGVIRFPALRPAAVGGVVFYLLAPFVAVIVALRRAGAIVCKSPLEAVVTAALLSLVPRRRRPPLVVEIHGDWRSAGRLYGSAWRRAATPALDALTRWAVTRADRVRAVSGYTAALARSAGFRGEIDVHVAFGDLDQLLARPVAPLRAPPTVAFVGTLASAKGPDVLLEAWPRIRAGAPGAALEVAGSGPARPELERAAGPGVIFHGRLPRAGVAELLDRCWCLAVPSRTEGLGRVVLEAMARGRAVVASDVGGLPELVIDGETGRLVPPGDPAALASAILGLLTSRRTAAKLGDRARTIAGSRSADQGFEAGTSRLAQWLETA